MNTIIIIAVVVVAVIVLALLFMKKGKQGEPIQQETTQKEDTTREKVSVNSNVESNNNKKENQQEKIEKPIVEEKPVEKIVIVSSDEVKHVPNKKPIEKKDVYDILVAEDDDSNYMLVKAILRHETLTRAVNGKIAVELAAQHKYDVILMDMKMPVMNGLDATREIRKADQDIRIIAVTANAFDSDRVDAMAAGCDAFISKPLKGKLLRDTIEGINA